MGSFELLEMMMRIAGLSVYSEYGVNTQYIHLCTAVKTSRLQERACAAGRDVSPRGWDVCRQLLPLGGFDGKVEKWCNAPLVHTFAQSGGGCRVSDHQGRRQTGGGVAVDGVARHRRPPPDQPGDERTCPGGHAGAELPAQRGGPPSGPAPNASQRRRPATVAC